MAQRVDIRVIVSGMLVIRNQCDMLLGLMDHALEPEAPEPKVCNHEHRKLAPGSTMGNVRYICEDCGKELEANDG